MVRVRELFESAIIIGDENVAKSDKKPSPFIFPSERSDHIHEDTLTDEIHDLFQKLRIEEANFHSTRHTVKTNLSKLRVLAEIRDRIMNHSIQKKTVGQIYDHYDYFEERLEALAKWEKHINKIVA